MHLGILELVEDGARCHHHPLVVVLVDLLLIDQVHTTRELAVNFWLPVLALRAFLVQEIEGVSKQVWLRYGTVALDNEGVSTHLSKFFRRDVLGNTYRLRLLSLRHRLLRDPSWTSE